MVSGAENEAGNPFVKVDLGRRTTELTKTSLFKSPQDRSFIRSRKILNYIIYPEVKFVHPVSPGGSVKFVASCVNFSIFTDFLCFFLLKLLKLGEIGGVKFLT